MIVRDAEHFHNPHAVSSLRASPLSMAAFRHNLRSALEAFPRELLAHELAEALQNITGSKGLAFNLLDDAAKLVSK